MGTPSPPGRGTEAAARLFKPSHDATPPQDGRLGPTRGQGADGAHQERRSGGRARSRDRYPTPKDFVFAADVPSGRRQATGPPTRVPGRPDSRDVVATLTTGGQHPRGPGSPNGGNVAAKRQSYCTCFHLARQNRLVSLILPQVHLRKPCYDFYFLVMIKFDNLLGKPRPEREKEVFRCRSLPGPIRRSH